MQIKGVAWLGTRTARYNEMVAFARDVLGLAPSHVGSDMAVFPLPNGDLFEIFGPENEDLPSTAAPVAGFLVDDIDAARAELEAKGVVFLDQINRYEGSAWTHFRAPDGHVYEITSRAAPTAQSSE